MTAEQQVGPKLTEIQSSCLAALRRHGGWPGGWYWDNSSGTARILDALVRKGYAAHTPSTGLGDHYGQYRPTTLTPPKEDPK